MDTSHVRFSHKADIGLCAAHVACDAKANMRETEFSQYSSAPVRRTGHQHFGRFDKMGSIFFSSLEIRQDKDYFCGIFADPTVIVLLFGDYDGANQIDVRRS